MLLHIHSYYVKNLELCKIKCCKFVKNVFTNFAIYKCYNSSFFPNPFTEAKWHTYVLSKETFGRWSLMFEHADTKKAFAIELLNKETMENGNVKVIVRFFIMDLKNYPDLRKGYVGKIASSGFTIFDECLKVLRTMGGYKVFANNCQDFIDELAKSLGVHNDVKTVTDHKIKLVSTLTEVGVEAGVVFLIFNVI